MFTPPKSVDGPETLNDTGIVIVSPKRYDGEFWTFGRQQDGVLKCHTSLLESGNLVKIKPKDPLIIHLPKDVEVMKKSQRNGVITIQIKKS
jgi:hypothetical protein